MKNCIAFKYKVQELVQAKKVRFEKLNEQDKVEHSFLIFSRAKEDMTKESQDEKIKEKDVECSLTTLKSKSQLHETVGAKVEPREGKEECLQEEKKMLQNLIQNLERMFNEQKEHFH